MDGVVSTLSLVLIVVTLAVVVITTQFTRRRRDLFALRRIAAYESFPLLVGRSVESSQPLHISLGSAGLGGENTLLAIASAELAYQAARQVVIGDAAPILTLSAASALPLGQDTLRRAYQARGLLNRYDNTSVRWYPAGTRSLAFAAAITALHADDNAAASIFAGSYGPELALMLDSAHRRQLPTVAVSDQLEGQAVAYALADAPLIGEEVFAAGSYLEGGAVQTAEAVALDVLRWLLIFAIVAAFVASVINNGG